MAKSTTPSTKKALADALAQLEALGTAKMRAQNEKQGAGSNQYGVKFGDIRKVAKPIKTDHELALALWDTENVDARLLAILVMKVKALSVDQMDRIVRSIEFVRVADWFNAYVAKRHPDKETLRERWMADDDPMAARSAWFLTAERVAKGPAGLDLTMLLDRLEAEMGTAAPQPQWTMNSCLAEIGIHSKKHRKRAIAIGQSLGIYRDYPVSKGCTSPFAPIWIKEMVKRQSA